MKKNMLKILLVIILIVIIIFLVNTFRKFLIIQEIQEDSEAYISSTNYYLKISTVINDEVTSTTDVYRKAEKLAVITEAGDQKTSMYNDGEKTDIFIEDTEGKEARLNTSTELAGVSIPNYLETENTWRTFCASLFSSIKEDVVDGKECYIITGNLASVFTGVSSSTSEIQIEKGTGLCIKIVNDYNMQEYEYEFDDVQDEIFIEPDVEQYEVIEE